jgi:hypothetical protein
VGRMRRGKIFSNGYSEISKRGKGYIKVRLIISDRVKV